MGCTAAQPVSPHAAAKPVPRSSRKAGDFEATCTTAAPSTWSAAGTSTSQRDVATLRGAEGTSTSQRESTAQHDSATLRRSGSQRSSQSQPSDFEAVDTRPRMLKRKSSTVSLEEMSRHLGDSAGKPGAWQAGGTVHAFGSVEVTEAFLAEEHCAVGTESIRAFYLDIVRNISKR